MSDSVEIPTQFVLDELQDRLQAKERDLVVAGARIRQLTEELRVLQQSHYDLQQQQAERVESDLPLPA